MNVRMSWIAGLCALAATLSAPRAQVGMSMSAEPNDRVMSCAYSPELVKMSVPPGSLITTLITTPDQGQPWVLVASAGTISPFVLPGIDGQLLIDPKVMVVIAGGTTGSIGGVSSCSSNGAKLALEVPPGVPADTAVFFQALAGTGTAGGDLKLAFSAAYVVLVANGC